MPILPLSLYIHFPWCVRKCPYCDFNSHEFNNAFPETDYLNALIRDLELEAQRIGEREIISIFMGGGTPSLFSSNSMEILLNWLRDNYKLASDIEITLEANPGTAEAANFSGYNESGINRLSIGVQSFDDAKLSALGRIHNVAEAKNAIKLLQAAGFENFNMDIMYGLPEQNIAEALRDLETCIEFNPAHISWYQLTIEPNTVFHKRRPALPEEELFLAMQEQGQQLLARHGYEQYEISAYARAGYQSKHNLNYWQFGDYLGVGAGAHSKVADNNTGVITRHARHRLPQRYMELAGTEQVVTQTRLLEEADISLEFMMNALRLKRGFEQSLFEERTGLSISKIENKLAQAEEQGFLSRQQGCFIPTQRGSQFLNNMLELF